MNVKKVVVTDYNFSELDQEEAVAKAHFAEFGAYQCKNEDETTKAVKNADVVVVQFAPMTKKAIDGLPHGARIIRYGVGFDNINLQAAAEKDIIVAYVPDYCTDEVADHTASMLLSMLRKLNSFDQSVRGGEWNSTKFSGSMPKFTDTVVGFLGLGRIGFSVLERLRPFGFQFSVFDPYLSSAKAASLGVRKMDSAESLAVAADALTLHLPVTDETKKIINDKMLKLMKPTAVLVNTARGELIDETACASALKNGEISAAALDVFSVEPLQNNNALRDAPNLILTPHAAWYSDVSGQKLQSCVADEIRRGLLGEPARQPVPGL